MERKGKCNVSNPTTGTCPIAAYQEWALNNTGVARQTKEKKKKTPTNKYTPHLKIHDAFQHIKCTQALKSPIIRQQ